MIIQHKLVKLLLLLLLLILMVQVMSFLVLTTLGLLILFAFHIKRQKIDMLVINLFNVFLVKHQLKNLKRKTVPLTPALLGAAMLGQGYKDP